MDNPDTVFYNNWLGKTVKFKLSGLSLQGEVIAAERQRLVNGIHDILEVEVWDNQSQVKIKAHRQKFTRIS